MKELNKETFEEFINSGKVVVDFNADWCGPCRMLKPILEELATERSSYKFASVNIDNEELLAAKYNVSSIPCLIIFENGKEIERSIGLKSKEDLESMLGE